MKYIKEIFLQIWQQKYPSFALSIQNLKRSVKSKKKYTPFIMVAQGLKEIRKN